MSQDESTQTQINTSSVQGAIQALKEKGFDINPYTISDELNVPKEELYRNQEVMSLILEARGNDCTFTDTSEDSNQLTELEKTVEELERENTNLAGKILELEKAPPEDIPTDAINDQVMELLQSESQEEIKALKEELAQRVSELNETKEENADQDRTIRGLEKVNEAVNQRMRELENRVNELSAREGGEASANNEANQELEDKVKELTISVSGLERVNEAINQRMRELEDENKALKEGAPQDQDQENEKFAAQNEENNNLKNEVAELNQKLEDLQTEADNLASQLQNAWHGGYEKGLSEAAHATQSIEAPLTPSEDTGEIKISDESLEDRKEEAITASQNQIGQVEAHNLKRDESAVINFTQAGPYVSSSFNPIEELSWRDLETVYSMGVLSVKDIGSGIPEPETEQFVKLEGETSTSSDLEAVKQEAHAPLLNKNEAEPTNPYDQDGEESPETMIPDFDQLDIFEDIEELEALKEMQVPDDMLKDVPVDEVQEEKATGDDLRDLIQKRIQQAQEHNVEQTVRTPPAPGEDEEAEKAAGFLGKNKFVGQNVSKDGSTSSGAHQNIALKTAPREIRKACAILGISPEDLTKDIVNNAWKKQIASPGVHPDLGGDTEAAVILNSAKDELLRFLESSAPKLGKKFGASKDMSSRFTGKKKQ